MTIINQFGGKIVEIAPKILNTSYANHRNKRVTFKPDVQEQINKLDTKPGVTSKNNPSKCKPRIINDDVSARTRLKAIQLDKNIGISTRSKLQQTYKLSVQTLLFP